MDQENDDLIYSPKRNWHVRKKWNESKRARHAVKGWYIRNNENIVYTDNGIPVLLGNFYDFKTKAYVEQDIYIYFYNDIERKWLRKYRHRNDKGGRGYWTTNTFVTGKSSREGMREKARWWQEANEYESHAA